jgi:HEAT repeat protein
MAAAAAPALAEALDDLPFHAWFDVLSPLKAIGPGADCAVPKLLPLLKHKDSHRRYYAIEALGAMGPSSAKAVPSLLEELKDPKSECREVAVKALGGIGPQAASAIPALVKEMEKGLDRIPFEAAKALWCIEHQKSRILSRMTETLLRNRDVLMARRATEVLAEMGAEAKEAGPALIRRLQEEKPKADDGRSWPHPARWEIAAALSVIAPQDRVAAAAAVPVLLEWRTGDRQGDDRGTIFGSLKNFGPLAEKAVPAILAELSGGSVPAIEAAGGVGQAAREAVPTLIKFLVAPDYKVRKASAIAIRQIGVLPENGIEALKDAMEDWHEGVREEAARTLRELAPGASPETRGD